MDRDDAEYELNWEKVAEMLDIDVAVARQLQEYGANCPMCGDYLQHLGEMIQHKHDFDVDDLREMQKKSGDDEQ